MRRTTARSAFISLVTLLLMESTASAATVIYRVRVDVDGPKTYRVTVAVVGDDNSGLVSYGVGLSGSGITLEHVSPYTIEGRKGDEYAPAGFTPRFFDPPPLSYVGGLQQVNPTIDPQAFAIYNFGKNAGSFATEGISPSATLHFPVWDAELVVGKGTYTSSPPQLIVPSLPSQRIGQVFISSTSRQYRQADSVLYGVPEPSTLAITAMSLVTLFGRQRKHPSHCCFEW